MRISIIDRIIIALAGLILLVIGIGVFVLGLGIYPIQLNTALLTGGMAFWQRAVMLGSAILMCLIGIHGLLILLRSRREKGFIMQHTENGDLSISMHAMESMVKKCIDTHEELKVSNMRIHRARDGVIVDMRISLAGGVNIPITVNALQKQIKHYITSCSGVDVKEVKVMVDTNNSALKPPVIDGGDILIADAEAAQQAGGVLESVQGRSRQDTPSQQEKEPLHTRLFKHEEEEQVVPAPPAQEEAPPPTDAADDAAPAQDVGETAADEAQDADEAPVEELVEVSVEEPVEEPETESVSETNGEEERKEV